MAVKKETTIKQNQGQARISSILNYSTLNYLMLKGSIPPRKVEAHPNFWKWSGFLGVPRVFGTH